MKNQQHDYFDTNLTDDEVEFVRQFVRTGFNGDKAARFTYGLSSSGAYARAKHLLSQPKIHTAILQAQQTAMDELGIGATWVLQQAVEVYDRCMQVEKILDRDGSPTGAFRFDAANAIRALKLIADISTFNQTSTGSSDLVHRLRRGRQRVANRSAALDELPISFM